MCEKCKNLKKSIQDDIQHGYLLSLAMDRIALKALQDLHKRKTPKRKKVIGGKR
jgi:hypothetical protein